jgi:hypothetical protein
MSRQLALSIVLAIAALTNACGGEVPDDPGYEDVTVASADAGRDAADSSDARLSDDTGGTLRCSGSATACTSLPLAECNYSRGCARAEACGGVASSCSGLTQTYCTFQKGCTWSAATYSCSGNVTACAAIDPIDCAMQEGCRREDSCAGVVAACDSLDPVGCKLTAGCRLE